MRHLGKKGVPPCLAGPASRGVGARSARTCSDDKASCPTSSRKSLTVSAWRLLEPRTQLYVVVQSEELSQRLNHEACFAPNADGLLRPARLGSVQVLRRRG